jgi:hypothetical protein
MTSKALARLFVVVVSWERRTRKEISGPMHGTNGFRLAQAAHYGYEDSELEIEIEMPIGFNSDDKIK